MMTKTDARTSKRNSLPPDAGGSTYAPDDWGAWESAMAAMRGGIVRDWPQWAQDAYRRHHGYLP